MVTRWANLQRALMLAVVVGPASSAAVSGQERVSAAARVVAYGHTKVECRQRVFENREALEEELRRLGWKGELSAAAIGRRSVVLVPLGAGAAGRIELDFVGRADRRVIRFRGTGDVQVAGRFVACAMPGNVDIEQVVFEADAGVVRERPAIRSSGAAGRAVTPAGGFPLRPTLPKRYANSATPVAVEQLQLLTDAVAYRAFVLDRRKPPFEDDADGAGIDFSRFVALVVLGDPARAVAGSERDVWPPVTVAGAARTIVRLQPRAMALPEPTQCSVWLVPRTRGPLDVELPSEEAEGVFVRERRFAVPESRTAPTLEVLRYAQRHVDDRQDTVCERVSSPGEWRRLRERLGEFEGLPDDWCDFRGSSVIVVLTEAGRVWPGFHLHVGEEEGVDVLTVGQFGPSGVDPGKHSYGFVAVVPDRKGQLSVVLQQRFGPGPPMEKTLRVFPGNGR